MAARTARARTEARSDEPELYFEMEFPGKDPDSISFSSKSIESFNSELTNPDSRQSPLRESCSRGSSEGPERPSTLTIPSLAAALPKLTRFKREAMYGSLPRTKVQHKVPRIHIPAMSVPTTPADSWERREGEYLRDLRDLSSSVSSVEEATEAPTTPSIKSKSRLSLNLGVFDSQSGSPLGARSPRFLPKFLRSSFSKLLQGKDRARTPDPPFEPTSLPFFSSVLSRSRCQTPEEELELKASPPSSPTTKTYVEESLAKGLPIIPFNYTPFLELERKKPRARPPAAEPLPGPPLYSAWGETSPGRATSAPASRKTSRREGSPTADQSIPDKSLSSLVNTARQEMEEEASVRKFSWIRGYASNNSRALQRRRSSVTEYVAPHPEPAGAQADLPEVQRHHPANRTRLRSTKSMSHQENLKIVHEDAAHLEESVNTNYNKRKHMAEFDIMAEKCPDASIKMFPENRLADVTGKGKVEMQGGPGFSTKGLGGLGLVPGGPGISPGAPGGPSALDSHPYLDMECGRASSRISGQETKFRESYTGGLAT